MTMQTRNGTPDGWVFDNRFIDQLPVDPVRENFRREVRGACSSFVYPTPVKGPKLVAWSREVAGELGLSQESCETDQFLQIFSGNRLLSPMAPYATCYGGHQFGSWAGQLGDGRAINLGEIVGANGKRWALQLKGAGPTPYSRSADGRAVLRSSLREYLCSEAMFHLGIPTTRALSLVLTGEEVVRDMFYNGNPKLEPGAIVCRVAPSFTRFGHFEILASRKEIGILRSLVDYTIRTDFPHLGEPGKNSYLAWFEEVCSRTAELIVGWMRLGFVHGVMNTDNMSILGLTIDYGPYGWLENYDPEWTPNITDSGGRRYRYGHQPEIAHWNLFQLANAIYPVIGEAPPLEKALSDYVACYERKWREALAQKLGLNEFRIESDEPLVNELFTLLESAETDWTIFFRNLSDVNEGGDAKSGEKILLMEPLMDAFYFPERLNSEEKMRWEKWLREYLTRVQSDGTTNEKRKMKMNGVNPKYILRNYLSQQAIDRAEQGDFSMIRQLQDLIRAPYSEQPERAEFANRRPEWARRKAGCSMLSCSS